ncbi:MAG: hypothetical protein ACOC9P_00410 [bacterium]
MTTLNTHPMFELVQRFADRMLAVGRGHVNDEQSPLFAGVIDVGTAQPQTAMTAPPPGIRVGDFNWCGNNMMHDVPLLEILNTLTQLTDDDQYAQAADDALAYYGKHCPHPESGLFPWGEHAQWSFADRKPLPCSFTHGLAHFLENNYMIHDHLRFAPGWFWEGIWKHTPDAVVNFARGLDHHIVNRKTHEHNRHGAMTSKWWRDPDNPDNGPGKDFARHSGFFIYDCLFAYAKSGKRDLLDWARRRLKWHYDQRLDNGLVRGCVRTPAYQQENQHDSLALCVDDAAKLLEADEAGVKFAAYARELFDTCATVRPTQPLPTPDKSGEPKDPRIWLDGYMAKPPFKLVPANAYHDIHTRTGIQWYADAVVETSAWLAAHLPDPPAGVPVLARRFRLFMEIGLSAYAISGDRAHLQFARRIAELAERDLWRNDLLLGHSNQCWVWRTSNGEYHQNPWTEPNTPGFYHSVTGTASLARCILRLALFDQEHEDVLGIDPHWR